MKHNEALFNPLPLPESLNLASSAGTAQEQTSQSNSKPKRAPKRNAKRKSPRTKQPGGTAARTDSETKWNRIKRRLGGKVAKMDKENLQEVLIGCGVAVGIVASVVVAIKLMPLATLILAVLGLAVALRFSEMIRLMPRPC
jgi:Flp pilus assembly protein TadB